MKEKFSILRSLIILVVVSLLLIFFIFIRQLYSNSNIRAFIVEISTFDSAIKQFYLKYESFPGDVASTVDFGLSKTNTDGNDDGLIQDKNGDIKAASGEVVNFWLHLSNSGFIQQNFDGRENMEAKIDTTFPRSVIGSDIGITAFGVDGKNYYQVGVMGANNKNIIMSDNSLKTSEALEIDMKLDDGLAISGRIVAVSGKTVNKIAKNGKCVLGNEYNFKTAMPVCQLRIEIGAIQ
jgi:hypothetical protein